MLYRLANPDFSPFKVFGDNDSFSVWSSVNNDFKNRELALAGLVNRELLALMNVNHVGTDLAKWIAWTVIDVQEH